MTKHTGVLFIGFVVVAAIAVVVIVNKNTNTEDPNTNTTETNTNASNANATVRPTDTDTTVTDQGITLLKPAEKTVVGEIVTYRFLDGNSLSIMPEALRSVVLNETPVKSENDVIDETTGVTYHHYTLASAKDGSLFSIVQVIQNSKLYDFRGADEYLNHLDQYVTFINN